VGDTERSESQTWIVMKIETVVGIRDLDCRRVRWMKLTSSCPPHPAQPLKMISDVRLY